MSQDQNFAVDAMQGRITLKHRLGKLELILEAKVQKDSEIWGDSPISHLEFPDFSEQNYSDEFDLAIKHFSSQMDSFKQAIKSKIENCEEIRSEYEDSSKRKHQGVYKGETRGGIPEGIGRFSGDDGKWVIEGEWEKGKLHGKVIANSSNGDRLEYEMKKGRLNGKFVKHYSDGGRTECEWKDEKLHGRKRQYDKEGNLKGDKLFREGAELT